MQLKTPFALPAWLLLPVCSFVLCLAAVPPLSLAQVKPARPLAPRAGPRPAPPKPAPQPAQPAAPERPGGGEAAQTPQPPQWVSRCASDARQGSLECAVEQVVYLSKTGQLVAAVTIRVPADTRQPTMAVQVPVGLYLPAGVGLRIDDGKPLVLALQTCDLKGCYAATPVSPALLAELKAGKMLTVSFQNLNKESIKIPLQLANFAEAYQRIQ